MMPIASNYLEVGSMHWTRGDIVIIKWLASEPYKYMRNLTVKFMFLFLKEM
jgi:hypothetical protein